MKPKQDIRRELTRNHKDQVFFTLKQVAEWQGRSDPYKLKKKLEAAGIHRNADKLYFIEDLVDYYYQQQR